ncbi:MAG TPA: plastocyanin/azurin family copper-binding protein [Candidatus Polarisedimenticolia bacterium]|nr:plastocyanin/azurin family copper-binding protein [Candidatus Polarisedimenticolia bacterium]
MTGPARWLAVVVSLLAAVLAAGSVAAADHAVEITNFAFVPSSITIAAGDTVTWTVTGGTHSIVSQNGDFADHPASMSTGESHVATFASPGSYAYVCGIHPFMQGTITILAPVTPSPPSVTPGPSASAAPAPPQTSTSDPTDPSIVVPLLVSLGIGIFAAVWLVGLVRPSRTRR